jgi:copper chaperone CopZ
MRVQFHLDGMHCEQCAETISAMLANTAGVRAVDVTLHGKTTNVEFDERILQSGTLIKKVQDLGYGVTVEGEPVSGRA